MLFIVMHHIFYHGQLYHKSSYPAHAKIAFWSNKFVYSGVDIFGLISGFVGYTDYPKPQKRRNYWRLWFTILLYNVTFAVVFRTKTTNLYSFLAFLPPLLRNDYWYFTAYTGLFCIAPILNAGVRGTELSEKKLVYWRLLIVFSLFDCVFPRFHLHGGYSCIWVIILYIHGALIRAYDKQYPLVILVFCLASLYSVSIFAFLACPERKIPFGQLNPPLVFSYNSYLSVWISTVWVLIFAQIKVPNWLKGIIQRLSSHTFAIYVITDNINIRTRFFMQRFDFIFNYPASALLPLCILIGLAAMTASILLDIPRQFIWKIIQTKIR